MQGRTVLFEGSHIVKATPTITPKPTPEQFTQGPKQAETTNTRKTAKTNMSATKPTAALKLAPVTTKWQVAKTAKSKAEDPKSANKVVPPHPNQSLLEGISDLLDKLPLDTCGTDLSATHNCTHSSYWEVSPAGHPENCHSFCG